MDITLDVLLHKRSEKAVVELALARQPRPQRLITQHWESGTVAQFYRQPRRAKPALAETARFWALADKPSWDDCWRWNGEKRRRGYGKFYFQSKAWVASRLAYILYHGRHPSHLVCHRCDNPGCINPLHLFDGTTQDNAIDMVSKGRNVKVRGVSGKRSPLTEDSVREIKRLSATGINNAELGRRFGVHRSTIRVIVTGCYWKDIKS